MLRMMAPAPLRVPAARHFALYPGAREELARERYAEVSTLAVAEAYRGTDTGLHLRADRREALLHGRRLPAGPHDLPDALPILHRTDPPLHAWMTEGLPVG